MEFADTYPVEWKYIWKIVTTNTSEARLSLYDSGIDILGFGLKVREKYSQIGELFI